MYCDGHVLFSIFAYKAVEHHDCEVDSDEIGRQRLPILTKHNNMTWWSRAVERHRYDS